MTEDELLALVREPAPHLLLADPETEGYMAPDLPRHRLHRALDGKTAQDPARGSG